RRAGRDDSHRRHCAPRRRAQSAVQSGAEQFVVGGWWVVVAGRRTNSEAETQALAREIAATLEAGDVLLLAGDLGAGKTTFVKGLAAGLGIDPADVSSPTFTLVHEYRGGRLTLYHADLYRLERTATGDLGLEEL